MKTSEVLRKAADEIRDRGLYQGEFAPPGADHETCPVCSWGAINVAANGDPWNWFDEEGVANEHPALHALARVVTGNEWRSVPSWNDAEERTVEEVLDAFEKAAELAEEQDD